MGATAAATAAAVAAATAAAATALLDVAIRVVIRGMAKAAVLPLPICVVPSSSQPANAKGVTHD